MTWLVQKNKNNKATLEEEEGGGGGGKSPKIPCLQNKAAPKTRTQMSETTRRNKSTSRNKPVQGKRRDVHLKQR